MYHPTSPPQAASSQSILQPSSIPGRLRLPVTSSLPNLRRDHKTDSDGRPMGSQPGSPGLTNAPSPVSLQNHIYTAFLERRTADVALHVRGSWHAIYKLHRVVLIQAGFFQSLFTSGFAESKIKLTSHRLGPDVVDIVVEDPNITRAAFEICIAHLYGGGPELFVSPTLVPTTKQPLTSIFPVDVGSESSFLSGCPADRHPATPRFLLSLLATAVFLSITPIATQAMSSILNTIGPYTVIRYLNFALGRGIGEPDYGEPDAAVGLEEVAEVLEDERDSILEADESTTHTPRASITTNPLEKLKDSTLEADMSQLSVEKEDPSEGDSSFSSAASTSHFEPEHFFYGVVSDKIGEAAACWLARWGTDMLQYELQLTGRDMADIGGSTQATGSRRRALTVPGGSHGTPFVRTNSMKKQIIPVIWRRGGLTARWVRGLLSSDMFFVAGEKERYDTARRVVELRRADGVLDGEEMEYDILFAKGIYYANMGLDELISISRDVSSATGRPYVPLTVLQSAHWGQSVLRHTITSRSSSTSSPPASPEPSPQSKELGVSVTGAELASALDQPSTKPIHATVQSDALYYPVPVDSSQRIGDNTGIEGASLDHLFEGGSSTTKTSDGATVSAPCSEVNFFGIEQNARAATQCAGIKSDKARWSSYPPFRFSVEFWDVEALKEKSRLHSRTVWYAGSLWNVYVQVVRKKGIQLGVYLHRQSYVDPIPPSSTAVVPGLPTSNPPTPAGTIRREPSQFTGVPLQQTISSPSVQYPTLSRSATPHTAPPTPAMSSSLPSSYYPSLPSSSSTSITSIPATAPPVSPSQPYRDPRPAVSAYFTIACAGSTGSSLTRFSSAPDVFSVSQSWGWKSSSLRTAENSELDGDGIPRDSVAAGREVSLRATVMLGII